MLQQSNITGDDPGDVIGDVTIVTSPLTLQEAIAAGAEHIEIRAHLDLTVLEKPEQVAPASVTYILGTVTSSVKSIRVRFPMHEADKFAQFEFIFENGTPIA